MQRAGSITTSSERLEAFLANIYVDAHSRERFLANPRAEALAAGLSEEQASALERIDRVGLELAAHSFERKRMRKRRS